MTPFELKIIGVSKTGKQKEGFNQTYEINELDELLGEADIIINTLPETKETSFINQQKHIYDSTLTGKRLKDEIILFLGTGAIAQDTVKLLTPFELKIIGVSKKKTKNLIKHMR